MTNRLSVMMIVLAAALAATAVWLVTRTGDDAESTRPDSISVADVDDGGVFDHDYVIPLGTADQIREGVEVEILPRELVMKVGETIRIVNDDDEGHVVGVFYVGAGETLTQRFDSPGELSGQCDVHPSGEFTLRVVA